VAKSRAHHLGVESDSKGQRPGYREGLKRNIIQYKQQEVRPFRELKENVGQRCSSGGQQIRGSIPGWKRK